MKASWIAIIVVLFGLVLPASAKNFIPADKRFSPTSERQGVDFGTGGPSVEEGIHKGMSYRFFHSDGSGVIGDWIVTCETDAMTDRRTCWAQKGDLWVYALRGSKGIISIGNDHFPGSKVYLRIGSGNPISASSKNDGDLPPSLSASAITKLKAAQSATTRYMEWPYRQWIDQTVTLEAFPHMWEYLNWAVNASR